MSRPEIAAVNRQFEEAARKGDVARLASLYTAGAIALPPDSEMVKGRDNIKRMWATVAQQLGLEDVRLNTLDLEVAGETAYEVGEAALTLANGNAAVKFVVVRKRVDGQWRLHRDIWNAKAPNRRRTRRRRAACRPAPPGPHRSGGGAAAGVDRRGGRAAPARPSCS